MIKKLITLFKLGRKIAKSDILKIASKFKKPPLAITILFQILSISFEKKEQNNLIEDDGERLSRSLESMGTTFIKLGQFLACLLYTSPSPRDVNRSRMPSSA